jgi:hypothetical protein
MTRVFKTGVSAQGDVAASGAVTASGNLRSTNSSGDEGGEIFLSNAATNTTLTGGITIDVWQNRLRFFEQGGSNRGYYLDISAGENSVGTNLVSAGGGGSGTVTSITAASPLTGGTITSSGTIGINASSTNTANYVVQRDASGNFAANQITAVSQKFGTGAGAPSFDSYSGGVRAIYYDNIGASSAGYTVGINSGEFWHTTSDTTGSFTWYGGTTLAATLTGTGEFTASSLVKSGGTSSEFLKADGSVDTTAYTTNTGTVTSVEVSGPLTGGTITGTGTIGINASSSTIANYVVQRDANGSFSANVVTANSFAGSGTNISSLNASNVSSGTLGSAYLPIASGTDLGGIKIGTNVLIDGSGAISVPVFDSFVYEATAPEGFTTSATTNLTTTNTSTVLTLSGGFSLDSGYSILNSNSSQTIAGEKTFSGVVSFTGGVAGAAEKVMTVASAYSGSTFAALDPRVIMTASETGAADPTTRPDGTDLVAGDIWIDW